MFQVFWGFGGMGWDFSKTKLLKVISVVALKGAANSTPPTHPSFSFSNAIFLCKEVVSPILLITVVKQQHLIYRKRCRGEEFLRANWLIQGHIIKMLACPISLIYCCLTTRLKSGNVLMTQTLIRGEAEYIKGGLCFPDFAFGWWISDMLMFLHFAGLAGRKFLFLSQVVYQPLFICDDPKN